MQGAPWEEGVCLYGCWGWAEDKLEKRCAQHLKLEPVQAESEKWKKYIKHLLYFIYLISESRIAIILQKSNCLYAAYYCWTICLLIILITFEVTGGVPLFNLLIWACPCRKRLYSLFLSSLSFSYERNKFRVMSLKLPSHSATCFQWHVWIWLNSLTYNI